MRSKDTATLGAALEMVSIIAKTLIEGLVLTVTATQVVTRCLSSLKDTQGATSVLQACLVDEN